MRLDGKRIIITGAGSGIGAATTALFAAEGARILAVDRDPVGLARTVAASATGAVATLVADVSDEAAWQRIVDADKATLGGIDVLFNNAGVDTFGTVVETTPDEWDRLHAVNIRGVFLGCRAVLPHMIEAGGGTIVNTASELGTVAVNRMAAYVASKFAVIGLTKSIAVDFAKDNIRANALCPGPVDTPLLQHAVATRIPPPDPVAVLMGRFGHVDELANAALFLASDESSFMTGATLVVDGGLTAK